MPGIPLNAYIVIDNSVLSLLCEYWCNCHLARLSMHQRIVVAKKWFEEQIAILRQYTPDGKIHCTDCVASEFKPEAGRLGQTGIAHSEIQALAKHVCSMLLQTSIDAQDIQFLRDLPNAPRKLVGPQGLSDNDFSLIALGAMLAENRASVYLLTNDQDVLSFTTWVRANTPARDRWENIGQIQGLHGLTYLESIHRDCKITTQEMKTLLNFAMLEHYCRSDLKGTPKGTSIMRQLTVINDNLLQSVQIKLAQNGGVL